MATGLDLVSSSLRLINVLAAGETCPTDMANDALNVLNDMIDSWNTQRLAIYTTRIDDFPLTLNKQVYTLGTGGDFNIARPSQITGASSVLLYNPTNPVEVPITLFTVDQWQTQIPVKVVPGTFPLICYDDGAFPLRNLSMWPIPSSAPVNFRLYSWQSLPAQSLAASVSFPPGYNKAFRFNLAVDLAAEFSAPVPAVVAEQAVKSFAVLKATNMPNLTMSSDVMPDPAGWNWAADEFGVAFQ